MSREVSGSEVEEFVSKLLKHLKEERGMKDATHHAFILLVSGAAYVAAQAGVNRDDFGPALKVYTDQVFDHFEAEKERLH